MKTIFTQKEIQQALVNYLELQGIVIKDRDISVTFVKGRGGNGLTAEVDITDPANLFAGADPEPVTEEPVPQETKEDVVQEVPKPYVEPPLENPDPGPEQEPETGNSVPSSDPLRKPLFSRQ